MTLIPDDLEAPLAPRDDDDEGLFSRDINGQLVRLDAPVESDYLKSVTLQVDGQTVTVPLAEPLKDAQGSIVLDLDGRTTPRYTTIYDAAVKLSDSRVAAATPTPARPPIGAPAGAPAAGAPITGAPTTETGADANPNTGRPAGSTNMPIPVLCHQPHMRPVAVCRLCVVQIYGQKRGKRAAERKLFPACQHPVKEGMEVFTMNAEGADGDRVRQAVKVMTELLTADHLKPAPAPAPAAELAPFNELQKIAERCGSTQSRFKLDVMALPGSSAPAAAHSAATAAPTAAAIGATAGAPSSAGPALPHVSPKAGRRSLDNSSPVFIVDHSACILCDRCSRACVEVKGNNVIGRTGKGASAGIGFDLNDPMGESSCVQCGECMVSCPTSAITFKPVAKVKPRAEAHDAEVMTAAELVADPLFAGVPPKFLLWQEGLVVKRRVKPNEVLCRQGEPGNTAFLIKSGRLQVTAYAPNANGHAKRGLLSVLIGGKAPKPKPVFQIERSPEHFVLGEMACLSGTPRTADVTAIDAGEVWEMRRNVLDRLMRSPALRGKFEEIYRGRALDAVLRENEVFRGLPADEYERCVNFLRPKLTFVRVNPLQVIFDQGDWADNVYLVRLGHVRISIGRAGRDPMIVFRGPGTLIGEIGLLAIAPEDAGKSSEAIKESVGAVLAEAGENLSAALPAARRTATCSALDHVELARVSRLDFLKMLRDFPTIRGRLIDLSLGRLKAPDDDSPAVRAYIDQGLYQGQNLLVLDLEKCTRCDECTRACVEQHGTTTHGAPVTRLLRDGLRFGDFLVATSCRSCKDAYCMIGCPVDSIHRGKHQQIIIEDHCIGCGLCATNCPYGNIWLVPNERRQIEAADPDHPGNTRMVAQPKAATCDLCDAEGKLDKPEPRCVYACPHDAAHRMTGEQLLKEVTGLASGD